MIPNLSELVREVLLSQCCYGDEGRGGSWQRKTGRGKGTNRQMINANTLLDHKVHYQNC